MEVVGIVALVILLLVPSLKKLLNSVAYRIRARGKAEIIRAERGGDHPRRAPSGEGKQAKQGKGRMR
ncbi:hypothetical protein AB0I98_27785 [Streptomyces sp. NPDC050211]|uniref:hypothetical protein n=1 Tax=Streptomyces sp. NPDC050211 TaxID=3154932 RepID=UPI0034261AD8